MSKKRMPVDRRRSLAEVNMGEVFRVARVEKSWTQAELAERLTDVSGVKWTQFMITSFETARRVISFSQAVIMAYVLGVDARVLLGAATAVGEDGRPAWAVKIPEPPVIDGPRVRVVK